MDHLIFVSATPYECYGALGLENGAIPSEDISISSKKSQELSVDAVRLGHSKVWTAATNDSKPTVTVNFPRSKNSKKIYRYVHPIFTIQIEPKL